MCWLTPSLTNVRSVSRTLESVGVNHPGMFESLTGLVDQRLAIPTVGEGSGHRFGALRFPPGSHTPNRGVGEADASMLLLFCAIPAGRWWPSTGFPPGVVRNSKTSRLRPYTPPFQSPPARRLCDVASLPQAQCHETAQITLQCMKDREHTDFLLQAENESIEELGPSWQEARTRKNASAAQNIPTVMFAWAI